MLSGNNNAATSLDVEEKKNCQRENVSNRWQSNPKPRAGLFSWPLGAIKIMRTKIRQKPRNPNGANTQTSCSYEWHKSCQ